MAIDVVTPVSLCLSLLKHNPHERLVNYRTRLRWATKEYITNGEDGARCLWYLLDYDKRFGKCPDTLETLTTWVSSNPHNSQVIAKTLDLITGDIDTVAESDIDVNEIPAPEAAIDLYLSEAHALAAAVTYQSAARIIAGKEVEAKVLKEFGELPPVQMAQQWVRKRWNEIPAVVPTQSGDWAEHAEDVSQFLDSHLADADKNRVYTGFPTIDAQCVIGRKFLKWIGILGGTSHGKSAFLLPMIYNMSRFGQNILLIPKEHSVEETWSRLTWMHSNYFRDKPLCSLNTWIKTPTLVTASDISSKNFLIDDLKNRRTVAGSIDVQNFNTWDEIKEYAESHHKEKQFSVIAVDYLTKLNVHGRDPYAARNEMLHDVQTYTQTFNNNEGIVVISPFQANKDGVRTVGKKEGDLWGVYEPEDVGSVNYYTEAAHDMDLLIGVWTCDSTSMKISCPKSRGGTFIPFFVTLDAEKSRYIYERYNKYSPAPTMIQNRPVDRTLDLLDPEL